MADSARRTVSPDDALPPVEPPDAAFLVQLFLVPGVIVAIIVFVWLAFHWLAHLGSDPQATVRTLRRDNEGRWQAALNLANDLRGPRGGALKGNEQIAVELGQILGEEAVSGRTGEQTQALRIYLCRALGEFAVPAAAVPLVERARDPAEPETARAAVEALAVLATNLGAAGKRFDDPAGVAAAVVAGSRTDNAPLRSAAAFSLGVLGGDAAVARLVELSGDAVDDVRFNAAVGLARRGRAESLDTLFEMLALPDLPVPDDPADLEGRSRRYKRTLVVVNALRALALLTDATNEAPPGRLVERVRELERDPAGEVRSSAAALREKIERVASAAKT